MTKPSQPDASLRQALEAVPRFSLAHLPTPLHDLPRLSAMLGGGHRVLTKRDDLTGLGMGGNKIRMLEYVLAAVSDRGYDAVLAGAEFPSNYCHQMAVSCAKVGLRCHLVLARPDGRVEGSDRATAIPLVPRLAASVDVVEPGWQAVVAGMERAAITLAAEGSRVFEATRPHASGISITDVSRYALGYAAMLVELQDQCSRFDIVPDELWISSGGPTQAGLVVARAATRLPLRIVGVGSGAVEGHETDARANIAAIANGAAQILGLDLEFDPKDIVNIDGDVVGRYGKPTYGAIEAIRAAATLEGLLVDPDYTGKALAALIAHLHAELRPKTVIFVHTGGLPSLFSFAHEFADSAFCIPGSV
ncbi:MAG: hypothetical protein DCC49_10715 [Acidobacteria bacterium]|nr:MAG: hypothetical protein DCC49_10715 [Acidobacteriota bacterium]